MKLGDYLLISISWLIWFLPFLLGGRREKTETTARDRRSLWGILLQGVGYALLWQGQFWLRSPELWRLLPAILFYVLASLLSWTGARALGKHWRFQAALKADHQLVRTGPYRFLRHPIYTSMLCMLLATGLMLTPWLLFAIALVIFLAGTEIRVRIEDGLLASRFGEEFQAYRKEVPAYIPLVR